MENYQLKLFINGQTPRSERAIQTLREVCEKELSGRYELVIIDVLEQPEIAESERILATPTLIRHLPPPLRKIIGDLSDHEKIILGLDLHPLESSKEQ